MEKPITEREIDYNYMSFTGYKSLLIFSLLIDGPKSFQEIAEVVNSKEFLKDSISADTLRVYINSFKRMGCEVNRIKGKDNISKYVITKHPFMLNPTTEQLESIIKIYKSLVKNLDIQELLCVYNFLEKLGIAIDNESFIAEIKNLSFLKDVNKNLLEQLITCCENNYKISVLYNSPHSGEKDIEIQTDKIEIYNNKIYLYGYGFEYNEYCKFPVSRIQKINSVDINPLKEKYSKTIKIVYELDNTCLYLLNSDEKILKSNHSTSTIEMTTTNLFLAKQRLLEYGYLCKIIEPEDFKNDFVKLLQDMKKEYSDD